MLGCDWNKVGHKIEELLKEVVTQEPATPRP
jgi:hypothetical protein